MATLETAEATTAEAADTAEAETAASAEAVPTTEFSATSVAATSEAGTAAAAADCTGITQIDAASAEGQQLLALAAAAYQAYGEGSTTATMTNLDQIVVSDEGWAIVQAEFEQAENGVLLLRPEDAGYAVASVWGGIVEQSDQIQDYFAEQVPDAPQQLLDCYTPTGQFVPTS